MKNNKSLEKLLEEVRACRVCEAHLPLGPRPVLRIHPEAKILISGQAPGTKVHETGIPWNDLSGKRLREWMGIGPEIFYDQTKVAVLPKGFCYPGKGTRGDLPPREECAKLWFDQLLAHMPNLQLILPIGIHSQAYFLKGKRKSTLAETVAAYEEYMPRFMPLPHPSPRNIMWFRKHSWFEQDIGPSLKCIVSQILDY
ncbi:MAG: uracil-DNA glycosylase family protein [Bacteroidia bacterium]